MIVSAIAAVSRNGVIGRDGRLPWNYPEDLRHFKQVTLGHALVMGRKTWESLGRPLPGRRHLVLTRNAGLVLPAGVVRCAELGEAVRLAAEAGETELFVIGGGEVYARALPRCDRLYLTRIEREVEGDARFPAWDPAQWREIGRRAAGELTFLTYERLS